MERPVNQLLNITKIILKIWWNLSEEHKILNGKEMKEITGSDYYLSGLFTPGTVMLQPAGYIRGLAQGLRDQGILIFENSPVTKIVKSEKNWQVKCLSGSIDIEIR